MSRATSVREMIAIPTKLIAVCAVVGVFFLLIVQLEVGKSEYTWVEHQSKSATPNTNKAIRDAMKDGKITQWEYSGIRKAVHNQPAELIKDKLSVEGS